MRDVPKRSPTLLRLRREPLRCPQPGRLLRAHIRRRRSDRGVPQVLLRDLNRHASRQRVAVVGVAQPVGAGALESCRAGLVGALPHSLGTALEEAFELAVQRWLGNACQRHHAARALASDAGVDLKKLAINIDAIPAFSGDPEKPSKEQVAAVVDSMIGQIGWECEAPPAGPPAGQVTDAEVASVGRIDMSVLDI